VTAQTIAVVSGGVGAARMLRALCSVTDPRRITAVVNTGDDTIINGLSISPDIDTITYTLAGAIDPDRGWGLVDETWQAMASLRRYEAVRPEGSAAAQTWFNVGDSDLATHLYRTTRLAEGATLTAVTGEIATAWGVDVALLPMCDEPVATQVCLEDGSWIGFQEYFVGRQHADTVHDVRFVGEGSLTAEARGALADADVVVIAPSNPILSIAPIRSLAGVDATLARRRDSVVAVSPIVGGAALKGPADRVLEGLGHESSVIGVAALYSDIAGTLVIDPVDAHLAAAVEAHGMRAVVTPSVMSSPERSAGLATVVLGAAGARGASGVDGVTDAVDE